MWKSSEQRLSSNFSSQPPRYPLPPHPPPPFPTLVFTNWYSCPNVVPPIWNEGLLVRYYGWDHVCILRLGYKRSHSFQLSLLDHLLWEKPVSCHEVTPAAVLRSTVTRSWVRPPTVTSLRELTSRSSSLVESSEDCRPADTWLQLPETP